MRFTPLSDEEISAQRTQLQEGEADFEVVDATEKKSKAGNEMIELKLIVWDSKGTQGTIFFYLVSLLQWKIKNFCKGVGMLNEYEAGTIEALSLIGKSGKCILKMQKDKSGKYPDKMEISEFSEQTSEAPQTSQKSLAESAEEEFDDDIPF